MKNVFFLFLLVFSTISSDLFAQISKGGFLLGGNFSISRVSSELEIDDPVTLGDNTANPSASRFTIQLGSSYLLNDQLAIGLQSEFFFFKSEAVSIVNLSNSETTTISMTEESSGYAIGPVLQFFQPFKNDRFGFQLEFSSLFGWGDAELDFSGSSNVFSAERRETSFRSIDFDVSPGLYFFANRRILLEASIGGISYTFRDEEITIEEDIPFPVITPVFDPNTSQRTQKSSDFNFFLTDGIGARIGLSLFFGGSTADD